MKWFGSSEKKESENYEKKYLARYKKQQKPKQKKNISKNKKDVEIESDEKNQVKVKIQKKEPESLSTKFESVKQEYNVTIKNLMDAKKVLNGIKEDIQKSNSEYADIISKTKLARVELLKTNNELQEKTEGNAKIAEEYKKQNLLTEEISNSKRELSEIKDEIMKYNSELESVRTNADNSPDFKKMMEVMQKKYVMSFSFFHSFLYLLDKEAKKHLNDKEINYLKQLFGMQLSDQNISEMLLGKIKYDPINKKFYESNKRVRINLSKGKVYEINDQK